MQNQSVILIHIFSFKSYSIGRSALFILFKPEYDIFSIGIFNGAIFQEPKSNEASFKVQLSIRHSSTRD